MCIIATSNLLEWQSLLLALGQGVNVDSEEGIYSSFVSHSVFRRDLKTKSG